jgi:ABC-2 type transport system ATP-binding protein
MTVAPVNVERLTKDFGQRHVVADVSLTVPEGQVLGFLGPNGAGKTTTLRCLLGLYRPSRGSVRIFGHDPAEVPAVVLADVGYLPGELRLPDAMTGRDILERCGGVRRLKDTTHRDQLVDRFGVDLDRPLGSLSKGNKQVVGLVLAFMHRPRLLLLDEPTSGLDPLLQEEFATLLREATAEGSTIVLSSHDLDEIQRAVQRVAIIRSGRVILDDTVEALRTQAPHTVVAEFDHDVDPRPLTRVPGVTLRTTTHRRLTLTYTGPAAAVLSALAGLRPDTLTARPANLDELFLRLYQGDPDEH